MSDRESFRYMLIEFVASAFFAFVACGTVVSSGLYVNQIEYDGILPIRALANALSQGLALSAVFVTFAFLDQTTVHPDDRDNQRFSRLRAGDTVLYRVIDDLHTHTGTILRIGDAEYARDVVEVSASSKSSRLEKWYAAFSEGMWGQWAYPFTLPNSYVVRDTLSNVTRLIPRSHIREIVKIGAETEVPVDGTAEYGVVTRQVSASEWEVELDATGTRVILDAWDLVASPHTVFRMVQINPLVTYALCLIGEVHPHFALMTIMAQIFGCFCGIGLVACGVPDARSFQLGVMNVGTRGATTDLLASPEGGVVFVTAFLQCFLFVLIFLVLAVDAKVGLFVRTHMALLATFYANYTPCNTGQVENSNHGSRRHQTLNNKQGCAAWWRCSCGRWNAW